MGHGSFWSKLESLIASARLVIDRPRGSEHPHRPGVRYPYDYGYLAGTSSGDGHGIDVWVGSERPSALTGVVCTVDLGKRDVELKLLLGCTAHERRTILEFHNSGSQAGILVEAGSAPPWPEARASQLTSPRLVLRAFEPSDATALLQVWNDVDVRRYLFDDEPVAPSFVEQQIRLSQASFAARGFGFFTIAPRQAPHSIIGFAGLRSFANERVELLYALIPPDWGQGYATEASLAVLRHAFGELGLREVWAGADPPNQASFRVMQRLGMVFREQIELNGRPARYYAIGGDEFLARVMSDSA